MRKIFTTVFIFHMTALLYFVISADMQKPKKKPLHVKMVVATPRSSEKKVATSAIQTAAVSKPKAPAPKPAKKENKPPVASKPIVNKKKEGIPAKKAAPTRPDVSNLLEELEETIAKIDRKRDKEAPHKQIETPKWLHSLKIDAIKEISDDNTEGDFTYQDTLIQILRESLDLPELGEVKIEITLKRDGAVLQLKVLAAESEKNRIYLEKNLSAIKFPPFDVNETRKTFVLTFCNE